ncbi:ABC transporter permease [Oceanirhabdus sp. W0125-5]|uniref:ABC transporter permease n=1 Tax=Oceanirhabdus sp. W0125-5 TaxID=2999116 RepID=UPI0022F31DD8|nr:ABC transporter permease [Oceanirhabdus sp. W0125-5]WBW98900.1 ABC transporter permease [Oceanirhabdus sp. W0125-5]
MLFNIFKREIKHQLKNITFYLFMFVILMFHFTQFGKAPSRFEVMEKPKKNYSKNIYEPSSHYEFLLFTIDKLDHDSDKGYTLKKSSYGSSTLELSLEQNKAIKSTYEFIKSEIDNGRITEENIKGYYEFSNSDVFKRLNELDKLLGGNTYYTLENMMFIHRLFPNFIREEEKFKYVKKDIVDKLQRDLLCGYTYKYNNPLALAKKYTFNDKQKNQITKYIEELKNQDNMAGLIETTSKIDTLLEGGSQYTADDIEAYSTLNETEKEYNDKMEKLIKKDKITGGFAREFCDYTNIAVGFFTAFIAAYILIRDKKNNIMETIYTKKFSPFAYVIGKYLAVSALMYGVILLLAGYVTIDFYREFALNGIEIDLWIFFKYATIWLLPTILFVNALTMIISVIFQNGLIAIIVQFILWQINVTSELIGKFNLTEYIIRFNTAYQYDYFMNNYSKFLANRGFYVIISIILVIICSIIFEKKRGNINGGIKGKFKFFKA